MLISTPQPSRNYFALGLLLLSFMLLTVGCQPQPKEPSWTKSKVLADGEDHPSKLLSDGSFVYYVTGGTVASMNAGTNNIRRISLKDATLSVLVKGDKLIPNEALALDEKFLYWSDGGNILRAPKEGGPSEIVVARAPQPAEMAVDKENIYWLVWTGEGSPSRPVMFASKQSGSTARQLAPPQTGANGLCIDDTAVYWTTSQGINKVAKTGGEATLVYQNQMKGATVGLAQDAENFYYMQMNDYGRSMLMKLPKKGGEPTQLAPSNSTHEFAVDDQNVYYFYDEPGSGSFGPTSLFRVPKNGGTPVMLDKGDSGWLKFIAVDNAQVYFTDISRVYALAK